MGFSYNTRVFWKQLVSKPQWFCYGILLFVLLLIYQQWSIFFSFKNSLALPPKKLLSSSLGASANAMKLYSTALFGQYIPKDSAEGIKASTLSLVIVGILYEAQPSLSQVTIKDSQDKEETYQVGDSLPGGAVIKQINPLDVVISFQGELQRLTLPNQRLIFEPQAKPLLGDE